MKIGFVSLGSNFDVKTWSGTNYFMYNYLKRFHPNTEALGGLKINYKYLQYVIRVYNMVLLNRYYEIFRNPIALKNFAKQINEFIIKTNPDIIISSGSLPVSMLETDLPVYIWSDATFSNLTKYYPWFTNLGAKNLDKLNSYEQNAFKNANKIFLSSTWAVDTAISDYDIDANKVNLLPLGANLLYEPSILEIEEKINNIKLDKIKILFLAVETERKGLKRVLEVSYLLKQKGINIEVNIVGCTPQINNKYSDFVNVIGFISKNTEEGMIKLKNYFLDSTFLFVPSLFEAFGLVFAEASAHALPSITSNVGGIPSVVIDGKNGYKFELDENNEVIVDRIIELISDIDSYKKLCYDSYLEYKNRLNWNTSIEKLLNIIEIKN